VILNSPVAVLNENGIVVDDEYGVPVVGSRREYEVN
jgi:hypothetical protein